METIIVLLFVLAAGLLFLYWLFFLKRGNMEKLEEIVRQEHEEERQATEEQLAREEQRGELLDALDTVLSWMHFITTYEDLCRAQGHINELLKKYQHLPDLDELVKVIGTVYESTRRRVRFYERVAPYDVSKIIYSEE